MLLMDQRRSSQVAALSPVQCAATAPVPGKLDLQAAERLSVSVCLCVCVCVYMCGEWVCERVGVGVSVLAGAGGGVPSVVMVLERLLLDLSPCWWTTCETSRI